MHWRCILPTRCCRMVNGRLYPMSTAEPACYSVLELEKHPPKGRKRIDARSPRCMNPPQISQGSFKNKLAFWRERREGRCKAPRSRRWGDIVEGRHRSRYPPADAPRSAALPARRSKAAAIFGYSSLSDRERLATVSKVRRKMPNYS